MVDIPTVVHAYNITRYDYGISPFFFMFGKHPRLPVDIAMEIEPKLDLEVADTINLRQRLELSYRLAATQAKKYSSRYNANYDKHGHGSTIVVGDLVVVQNVKIRCKNKLANLWQILSRLSQSC